MMVLLDSHVVHWWSAQPEKLRRSAEKVLAEADGLALAAVSWWELALLAQRERILLNDPIRRWFAELDLSLRTIGITPAIAITAASLPDPFPRDPADRLIYATALEHGRQLVTRDERMLRQPGSIAAW